jgi:hypothetical protein
MIIRGNEALKLIAATIIRALVQEQSHLSSFWPLGALGSQQIGRFPLGDGEYWVDELSSFADEVQSQSSYAVSRYKPQVTSQEKINNSRHLIPGLFYVPHMDVDKDKHVRIPNGNIYLIIQDGITVTFAPPDRKRIFFLDIPLYRIGSFWLREADGPITPKSLGPRNENKVTQIVLNLNFSSTVWGNCLINAKAERHNEIVFTFDTKDEAELAISFVKNHVDSSRSPKVWISSSYGVSKERTQKHPAISQVSSQAGLSHEKRAKRELGVSGELDTGRKQQKIGNLTALNSALSSEPAEPTKGTLPFLSPRNSELGKHSESYKKKTTCSSQGYRPPVLKPAVKHRRNLVKKKYQGRVKKSTLATQVLNTSTKISLGKSERKEEIEFTASESEEGPKAHRGKYLNYYSEEGEGGSHKAPIAMNQTSSMGVTVKKMPTMKALVEVTAAPVGCQKSLEKDGMTMFGAGTGEERMEKQESGAETPPSSGKTRKQVKCGTETASTKATVSSSLKVEIQDPIQNENSIEDKIPTDQAAAEAVEGAVWSRRSFTNMGNSQQDAIPISESEDSSGLSDDELPDLAIPSSGKLPRIGSPLNRPQVVIHGGKQPDWNAATEVKDGNLPSNSFGDQSQHLPIAAGKQAKVQPQTPKEIAVDASSARKQSFAKVSKDGHQGFPPGAQKNPITPNVVSEATPPKTKVIERLYHVRLGQRKSPPFVHQKSSPFGENMTDLAHLVAGKRPSDYDLEMSLPKRLKPNRQFAFTKMTSPNPVDDGFVDVDEIRRESDMKKAQVSQPMVFRKHSQTNQMMPFPHPVRTLHGKGGGSRLRSSQLSYRGIQISLRGSPMPENISTVPEVGTSSPKRDDVLRQATNNQLVLQEDVHPIVPAEDVIRIMSGNSKTVPRSPEAKSQAISGYAPERLAEKAVARGQLRPTINPFEKDQEAVKFDVPSAFMQKLSEVATENASARVFTEVSKDEEGRTFVAMDDARSDSSRAQYSETGIETNAHKRFLQEKNDWESALEPRHRTILHVLGRISSRLVSHLVDSEMAVKNIIDDYARDGKVLVEKFKDSNQEMYQETLRELEASQHRLAQEYKQSAGKLENKQRHGKDVKKRLDEWKKAQQQAVHDIEKLEAFTKKAT